MTEQTEGQVTWSDLGLWSGKMCPELSAATKEKTSRQSSKRSSASQSRKPPILKCLKKDGQLGGATTMRWEDDGAWLGESMTRNTGESPNAAAVSRLSQILEVTPQEKYSLSAKACQGILRRAERRGKDLPELLKTVLLMQSESGGAVTADESDQSPTMTAGDCCGVAYISGVDGYNGDLTGDVASTIGVNCGMSTGRCGAMELFANENGGMARDSVLCAGFKAGQGAQAGGIGYSEEVSPTLAAAPSGTNQTPAVVALDMSHACDVIRDCGEIAPSLQARMGTGGNQVPLMYQMQGFGDYRAGEVASSCKQRDFKDGTDLVCSSVDCRNFREGGEVNGTLQAKESGGQSLNLNNTVRQNMVVRRLTPMECERLQGFPDGWTDIGEWRDSKGKMRKPSDSPRYKALGNSIALPFWDFLAKRISAQYLRPVTMGSLFDGIGGFPLVFERHNGKGTARWASEIEEFPIAVTKLRFGED